jgi:Arc/MetJ family transcription regulator
VIRGLRVPVHLTSRDALRILDIADIWASRTGREVRLVSANDHVHSRRSAHYEGRALDFHSSDPEGLSMVLRQAGYRVLWNVPGHYSHVHVEETRARDSSLFAIGLSRDAVNKVLKVGLRTRAGVAHANASLPPAWRQQAN